MNNKNKVKKEIPFEADINRTRLDTTTVGINLKLIKGIILREAKVMAGYKPEQKFDKEIIEFDKKTGYSTVILINPSYEEARVQQS